MRFVEAFNLAVAGVFSAILMSCLSRWFRYSSCRHTTRPGSSSLKMRSTLGSMFAGKHYAAYHNFFNTVGMKLHYVVVPFEADRKTATQIAFRALVAAALNPTGATSH